MIDRRYDVVVIGSGAGGGAVAQALVPLVEQGGRVLVLEQGPRLEDHEFTGTNSRCLLLSTRTVVASSRLTGP